VITKRQHVQSRPDPYGRVPRKHSGHAGDGWQAHVYGSGRKPEQGYHGPRGEIDQINRSGVLDDGELDPEIKSEKKRKAKGPRMTAKRRADIKKRVSQRLKGRSK